MRIRWMGLLLLVLATVGGCSRGPEREPVAPEVLVRGAVLYNEHCAQCHGNELEGQPNWKTPDANGVYPAPPHDRSGHTWHHSDGVLLEIITHGGMSPNSAMPAYEGVLTEEEMRAVLAYIKSAWGPKELEFQEAASRGDAP